MADHKMDPLWRLGYALSPLLQGRTLTGMRAEKKVADRVRVVLTRAVENRAWTAPAWSVQERDAKGRWSEVSHGEATTVDAAAAAAMAVATAHPPPTADPDPEFVTRRRKATADRVSDWRATREAAGLVQVSYWIKKTDLYLVDRFMERKLRDAEARLRAWKKHAVRQQAQND